MDEMKKCCLQKLEELKDMTPEDKKCLMMRVLPKVVSFVFAVLFWKLRKSAKLEGKKCKSRVFLVISILFFVSCVSSEVKYLGSDEIAFDDDFEADFDEATEEVNE